MTNQQPIVPQEPLPLNENIAIYVRKAAPEKTTNPVDLLAMARQLGWTDEQITVFSQDNGLPGSAPVNKREGLQTLVTVIEQETIKAVLIADENRLFRGTEAIQVQSFPRLCCEHDICIVTPYTIYNLHNPQDARRFQASQQGHLVELTHCTSFARFTAHLIVKFRSEAAHFIRKFTASASK